MLTFQPRKPFHRRNPPTPPSPAAPPAAAHVLSVDRVGQYVVRFAFDTPVVDLGACGDLRVNANPPAAADLVDPLTVDATYTDLPAGPGVWSTDPIDDEPIFQDNAPLTPATGPVPPWV